MPGDRSSIGSALGLAGAALGVVAGLVQALVGDQISEWTGDKLHPVQLGLITIVLSLLAGACVHYLGRRSGPAWGRRVAAGLAIVIAAGICFTTVGRLWYVPGPLLIASVVILLAGSPPTDETAG